MALHGVVERTFIEAPLKPEDEGAERDGVVEASSALLTGPEANRKTSVAALTVAALIVVWALAGLTTERFELATLVRNELQGSEVVASVLAQLFAALVLGLFLTEGAGRRLRWVAAGLVALGLGHLVFGYVEPLIQGAPANLNESSYELLAAQTFACALFVIGLFPGMPRYLVRLAVAVPVALIAGYIIVFEFMEGESWMPHLTRVESPEAAIRLGSPFEWLTTWYWVVAALPLLLAMTAAVGAFRQSRRGVLQGWLLVVVFLLAGSVLHGYIWPSTYGGDVLTTADVLQLALAVVAAVGGVAELRRIATERAALLATEKERTRRLHELNTMRADFSAMIAHELGGPLTAIHKLNEILGDERADTEAREYAVSAIEGEIDLLNSLVKDVRAAAAVEREDFKVEPCSLPLGELLADAESYANVLSGNHPVSVEFRGTLDACDRVWADRQRVGQVLRNILSNAAKYSPEGAPIEVRAVRRSGRIRVEVTDHGPGIHPEDVSRIFEKFGRGRDRQGRKVAGAGLGLYLSRRIIRAHGGDLALKTAPGEGSVFSFELEPAK